MVLAVVPGFACGSDDDAGGQSGAVDEDRAAEVRDVLDQELRDTLATALFDNPGSRQDLLDRAQSEDPELWQEVNADGEVTLEEFRMLPNVQDAVNRYSGDVIQVFQDELAAARSDG